MMLARQAARARAARADRRSTPLQMRWLGALLLAAQLPQAPHLPIWVAVAGIDAGRACASCCCGATALRPDAPPARIPSWALALFAVAAGIRACARPSAICSAAIPSRRVPVHPGRHQVPRNAHPARRHAARLPRVLPARSRRSSTASRCSPRSRPLPAVLLVGATLDVLATPHGSDARRSRRRARCGAARVMIAAGHSARRRCCSCCSRASPGRCGACPPTTAAKTGLSDSMSPGDDQRAVAVRRRRVPRRLRRAGAAESRALLARPGAVALRRPRVDVAAAARRRRAARRSTDRGDRLHRHAGAQ